MALATRCPYCHTTFRVVQDQLKLFNGIVRCGSCQQIFNGVEQLLPQEGGAEVFRPERAQSRISEIAPALREQEQEQTLTEPVEDLHLILSVEDEAEPVSTALAATPEPVLGENTRPVRLDMAPPDDRLDVLPETELKPDSRREPQFIEPAADIPAHRTDGRDAPENDFMPTQFPDLLQAKQAQAYAHHASPSLELDEPQPEVDAIEEPEFMQRARRQQRFGRIWRIAMLIGVLLMLPTLLWQVVDVFNARIAAAFPALKPAIESVCGVIDCRVGLEKQIDQVTVEVSELHAPANGETAYTLGVVLRNRSAQGQVWPNIELTLNDSDEKAVARRIFAPAEFLPNPQLVAQGFAASSEQSIKLAFELEQIKPSGYRVYLFYP
ncbi:MAG: hypothetical protein H6R04_1304 [Burkholderiaceae bacterium]|nr:hypothetical protein [Burkholderiaceae bacterium]